MCIAIPGRVISIEGMTGIIDLGGVKRKTYFQLVPEVKAGDYVLVHAGFAIQVIEEEEAKATLELLDEYFRAEETRAEESR